jgi:hypothetical protein
MTEGGLTPSSADEGAAGRMPGRQHVVLIHINECDTVVRADF